MKKRFADLAAFCLVLAVATAGYAQDKRIKAKRLFDRGVLALEQHDYRNALDSFNAAYETSPHWMVLAHIGSCHAKLNDPVQAIGALEKFLEDGGSDIQLDERKSARKLLAEQHRKVGVLYLVVEPSGSEGKIDGKTIGFSPFDRILLPSGSHRIAVIINGKTIERKVTVASQQELTLRIPDQNDLAGAPRTLGPADSAAPGLESQSKETPMFSDDGSQSYGLDTSEEFVVKDDPSKRGVSLPFYVALGLAGAGFVTGSIGGGLYWHYSASENNWSDKLDEPQWEDFTWEDTCHSGNLRTVTNEAEQYYCENESTRQNYEKLAGKAIIPLIAGGTIVLVAGVASLVFYLNAHWFEKPEDAPAVALTPVLGDNYSGLMLSGKF